MGRMPLSPCSSPRHFRTSRLRANRESVYESTSDSEENPGVSKVGTYLPPTRESGSDTSSVDSVTCNRPEASVRKSHAGWQAAAAPVLERETWNECSTHQSAVTATTAPPERSDNATAAGNRVVPNRDRQSCPSPTLADAPMTSARHRQAEWVVASGWRSSGESWPRSRPGPGRHTL